MDEVQGYSRTGHVHLHEGHPDPCAYPEYYEENGHQRQNPDS